MNAINDLQLDKGHDDEMDFLNEADRALISGQYYSMRGMTEDALEVLRPVVDQDPGGSEEVFIQLLEILLGTGAKESFNEYFQKYVQHWGRSHRMPPMQSFYHEVNGAYEAAGKKSTHRYRCPGLICFIPPGGTKMAGRQPGSIPELHNYREAA